MIEISGRLVRQQHRRLLDALAGGGGCRKNDINVGSSTLITVSGERIPADQQVVNAVRVEVKGAASSDPQVLLGE